MARTPRAPRLDVDAARLLPRYRLLEQQSKVFVDELRRAERDDVDTTRPGPKVPTGDDRERLRGLPCVAREVTGAQPGTDPLRALLRKEARRERRR